MIHVPRTPVEAATTLPSIGGHGPHDQRFAVRGVVAGVDDPRSQVLLAVVHGTSERPRCLCVNGGVEMYVAAHHGRYVVKRMPETASQHHPSCPSFEVDMQESGLGQLLGDAVIEREGGDLELRVNFPWTRVLGRNGRAQAGAETREVEKGRHRLGLRGLANLLFERGGFNRWSPAMAGKRNQWVLHKYLQEAAEGVLVKGVPLTERLYVPEPFNETARAQATQRRHDKMSVLLPREGRCPLAIVLGEFKAAEPGSAGMRIWIKHMPDSPLLVDAQTWRRITRAYAPVLEARDADGGRELRLVLIALIVARREWTYEVDTASLFLTTRDWIPLDGLHELALIQALVNSGRRFIKPLRYEAENFSSFANALLLDTGPVPLPLHVSSPFMGTGEREAKARAVASGGSGTWLWDVGQAMPDLPAPRAP